MGTWKHRVIWLAAGLVFLGLLILFLGPVSWWLAGSDIDSLRGKERIDAVNSVRQLVLASLAGGLAAIGLIFTTRTYFSNRRGQVTDRYAKAIEQLASDKVNARIGGIYSLQHIMRESPEDHEVIVEVLTAFIREHSWQNLVELRLDARADPDDYHDDEPHEPVRRISEDIQAAIRTLSDRPERPERRPIDLSNSALLFATLDGGRFANAVMENCDLSNATLRLTDLSGARLDRCFAYNADFMETKLDHAALTESHLTWCKFDRTEFDKAMIRGADFRYSHFSGVDLRAVRVLLPPACRWHSAEFHGSRTQIPEELALRLLRENAKIAGEVTIIAANGTALDASAWSKIVEHSPEGD